MAPSAIVSGYPLSRLGKPTFSLASQLSENQVVPGFRIVHVRP